ncbi:MAG: hypothetical protein AAF959_01145 [Cyanobacteria bacterium P01_D01_bin.56]
MSIKRIVHQAASLTLGCVLAVSGTTSAAFAKTASERSMYDAGYNAGLRLYSEGYGHLDIAQGSYYSGFLQHRENRTITVDIPRTGVYVLAIGGDNDTVDLDAEFPQINGIDNAYGRTAFFEFTVYRPGRFSYEIDMLNCQTTNCGVYAILLNANP